MTDQPGFPPSALLGDPSGSYSFTASDWVAASTDRGVRKETNQDAVRIAAEAPSDPTASAILVVSDGVSTSLGSGEAAVTAATTACGALIDFLVAHPECDRAEVGGALEEAFALALQGVLGPEDGPTGSCTLIVGVVGPWGITVANVGDCRGYWVGDDGSARCLSTDDSVAQARIMMGIPREEAERGFQAHAITNWLGPDTPSGRPSVQTFQPAGPGWLVVCSDGLWNYASEPDDLATVVRDAARGRVPLDVTIRLIEWANTQGGHDNISVALARITGNAVQG